MKLQTHYALTLTLLVFSSFGTRSSECGEATVPNLPVKTFRYTPSATPGSVDDSTLRRLDNTAKNNPLTDAGATLGRVLFYDPQLSKNNTISCGSCHEQKHAFADPRRFSVGFDGGRTKRNAMSLVNLRFTNVRANRPGFFWDERAETLEAQVLMPIQDKVEMDMRLPALEAKLQKLSYYPALFQAAFGSRKVTSDGIAKAVAQFMRSMVSFDSKFDRAAKVVGNDHTRDFPDFNAVENLGKSLFIDGVQGVAEIGCAHCHVPPTFSMPKSFNNGLDLVSRDKGLGARDVPSNDLFTPSNDGKFKAPSLRNISLTAPYMHDGRFKTLKQVIDHYSNGVYPHPNLGLATAEGDNLKSGSRSGFNYTPKQKAALVAFLKTLTDKKFVNDPKFRNPFVRQE
jgi:cytochrome c peroxidase